MDIDLDDFEQAAIRATVEQHDGVAAQVADLNAQIDAATALRDLKQVELDDLAKRLDTFVQKVVTDKGQSLPGAVAMRADDGSFKISDNAP
jgi:predicted component of type VI protein secretion system